MTTLDLCNKVLHQEQSIFGGEEYFLPAYLIVIAKRFEAFDFPSSTLKTHLTLVLNIKWAGVPKQLLSLLLNIRLRLNNVVLELKAADCCEVKSVGPLLVFTMRLIQDITFVSNLNDFPFDVQYVPLDFELSPVLDLNTGCRIWFNFHVKKRWQEMFVLRGKDLDVIPEYEIAAKWVDTPEIVCDRVYLQKGTEKKLGVPTFPKIMWVVPLHREPEYVLLSSFVPLLLLNIVAMGVYALDYDDTSDKLSLIITVLLALFAFLPSYRNQMPNIPQITMMDVNLVLSVSIMLFGFVETMVGRYVGDINNMTIALFILSVVATVAVPIRAGVSYFHYVRYFKGMFAEQIRPTIAKKPPQKREKVLVSYKESKSSSEQLDLTLWTNPDLAGAKPAEFESVQVVEEGVTEKFPFFGVESGGTQADLPAVEHTHNSNNTEYGSSPSSSKRHQADNVQNNHSLSTASISVTSTPNENSYLLE